MTMLTDFASLSLDELTAEIEAMLKIHHAPRANYAAKLSLPAASVAAPSLVVAGVAGNLIGEIA